MFWLSMCSYPKPPFLRVASPFNLSHSFKVQRANIPHIYPSKEHAGWIPSQCALIVLLGKMEQGDLGAGAGLLFDTKSL